MAELWMVPLALAGVAFCVSIAGLMYAEYHKRKPVQAALPSTPSVPATADAFGSSPDAVFERNMREWYQWRKDNPPAADKISQDEYELLVQQVVDALGITDVASDNRAPLQIDRRVWPNLCAVYVVADGEQVAYGHIHSKKEYATLAAALNMLACGFINYPEPSPDTILNAIAAWKKEQSE